LYPKEGDTLSLGSAMNLNMSRDSTERNIWHMATKQSTRIIALLAMGAASLVLAGCSLLPGGSTGGDTASNSPDEGDDVFSIVVGDCLNDADVAEVVSTVPIVDCAEPHDSEAYYAEDLPDGDFPGDDAISSSAEGICAGPFESFVGLADADSIYTYYYYSPTEQSWENGDREILCVAATDDLSQVTGTLKGINQ
jgi:hypothetical protein